MVVLFRFSSAGPRNDVHRFLSKPPVVMAKDVALRAGKPSTVVRRHVNRRELVLAKGSSLRPIAARNASSWGVYRSNNALKSALWFALLSVGDEVITSESALSGCWEQVMSVGGLAVQISGGSVTMGVRTVLCSANVRTKAVYLTLPSAEGGMWSVRRVAMLAHALPKGVTLVLDMSDSYSSPLDMFNLRGHTFGPNVIILHPSSRPRMVGIFKQCGRRSPGSLKFVATFNELIESFTKRGGPSEDQQRRAAFNLFWTAKTAYKLRKLRWIACTDGPDGVILHFAKSTAARIVREHLTHYQLRVRATSVRSINVNFICSDAYELMISLLINIKSTLRAPNRRKLPPQSGGRGGKPRAPKGIAKVS
ncbi:MAG: hypothetical protein ACTS5A_01940 [Candidatus Hodgkinia cicadicola]